MAQAIIHQTRRIHTPMATAIRAIWAVVAVIETLLALRFLLRLFGANPAAGFTDFIYTISQPLAAPFLAVFPSSRIEDTSRVGVFDWSLLLAIAIYWLLAWGITSLLRPTRRSGTEEEIEYIEEV